MNNFQSFRRLLVSASLLLASLVSLPSYAQVELNISGAEVRGIPIAIVPFKVLDGSVLEHQINEVVAFDLAASGKFEPIAAKNYLSNPSRDEEVQSKDWRFIDAEVLVIGEVWTLGPDQYEVQFQMYDVAREQFIGNGKRISGLSMRDLRMAAHVISDNVYQAFTGGAAAFQSRMAYVSRTEVEYQRFRYRLMVADWDGFGAREVYASWNPLLSPDWSPDGQKLAFVGFNDKGSIVKVVDLTTFVDQTIADFRGVNSAPAWSPDGSKIAYSSSQHGSPDIFIYDVLTRQHTRISSHYGIDTEPSWSPRGESFLFTSSRTGKPQIYSYSVNDESVSRMTFEGDESANASYNPDGSKILMVHEGGQIAVMDGETSRLTMLTNAKFDESPSFSPNGDMVLYKTEQQYEPALVVASADGRVRTRLSLVSGDVREPAWSPLRK
ncbi:MAG: TolB protein [Arenicella sp.]|jgi:TolB protein